VRVRAGVCGMPAGGAAWPRVARLLGLARGRGLGLALALLLAPACGQGEAPGGSARPAQPPVGGGPPVVTEIRIAPDQARVSNPITAQARTSDPTGHRVDLEYQWLRNGAEIPGATAQVLASPEVKRGDEIAVRVTPVARGLRGVAVTSPALTLLNSPPVLVRLTVAPREVRREDTLKVNVEARDPDGDRLLLTYQWLRNGEEIPGATAATLAAKDLRKGDRITVRVTVSDLEATTPPQESQPAVILNSPPRVLGGPRWETGPDGTITYQMVAEDPDGDVLVFTLSPNAPKGMSLDGRTGILRFRPAAGDAGTHRFSVTINDGDGGAVRQELIMVIREQ